ncbi:MAG: multicopper oxidase domain-containing protein, partial [Nitrospiria bacterium]
MEENTQVQNLDAGPAMIGRLEDRLDQEIARAGGQLGGYVSGAEAHATLQGIPLRMSNEESVSAGGRCPKTVPVRTFDISAINIEITINRHLNYYPGYLYILTEDMEKVRAEERKNAEVRKSTEAFPPAAVSIGLQGDLIQPLVIRANAGDCVRIILRNQTHEDHNATGENDPVSLHIHGSSLIVSSTGQPATVANPHSLVMPGQKQAFEWYIPPDATEKAHPFHSHALHDQWALGLFGALVIEPKGSRHLDSFSGKQLRHGWLAIIEDPNG